VGLRLRPLLAEEIAREAFDKKVFRMKFEDAKLDVVNKTTARKQSWKWDWGFDEYHRDSDVYNDSITPLVDGLFAGFSGIVVCVGAQKSGKSHSVLGHMQLDGEKRGILPLLLDDAFKRIDDYRERRAEGGDVDKATDKYKFYVALSMCDIYGERITDVLDTVTLDAIRGTETPRDNGLRVAEVGEGTRVPGLRAEACESYERAFNIVREGLALQARSGETRGQSATTTVYTITLSRSREVGDENVMTKTSEITIFDCAATENMVRAPGDSSRSFLEHCVEKVVDGVASAASVDWACCPVTYLLKPALEGERKAVVLCHASPAEHEHDNLVGTATLGVSMMKIATHVRAEEEVDKAVEAVRVGAHLQVMNAEMSSRKRSARERRGSTVALQAKINEAERGQMPWEERVQESLQSHQERQALVHLERMSNRALLPHLIQLHQDSALSGKLAFFFETTTTRVCNRDAAPAPALTDIVLAGGIEAEHCTFYNTSPVACDGVLGNEGEKAAFASRISVAAGTAESAVFVNGKLLNAGETQLLQHNDRISLGPRWLFRFLHPMELKLELLEASMKMAQKSVSGKDVLLELDQEELLSKVQGATFDWDYAQKEKVRALRALTVENRMAEEIAQDAVSDLMRLQNELTLAQRKAVTLEASTDAVRLKETEVMRLKDELMAAHNKVDTLETTLEAKISQLSSAAAGRVSTGAMPPKRVMSQHRAAEWENQMVAKDREIEALEARLAAALEAQRESGKSSSCVIL
jgi:hypothetical protein